MVAKDEGQFEQRALNNLGEDPLENYTSLFDPESTELYTSIRNLFTLSYRGDIIKLIANIENFKKYMRQSEKDKNEEEKVNITAKHQALFESALLKISREVYSPIAKVIGYNQLIRSIIPNFDFIEGDQIQDCIYELTLNLNDAELVENLFIDIKTIREFVPESQWGQEHFVPVTHLDGCMNFILQKEEIGMDDIQINEA